MTSAVALRPLVQNVQTPCVMTDINDRRKQLAEAFLPVYTAFKAAESKVNALLSDLEDDIDEDEDDEAEEHETLSDTISSEWADLESAVENLHACYPQAADAPRSE